MKYSTRSVENIANTRLTNQYFRWWNICTRAPLMSSVSTHPTSWSWWRRQTFSSWTGSCTIVRSGVLSSSTLRPSCLTTSMPRWPENNLILSVHSLLKSCSGLLCQTPAGFLWRVYSSKSCWFAHLWWFHQKTNIREKVPKSWCNNRYDDVLMYEKYNKLKCKIA